MTAAADTARAPGAAHAVVPVLVISAMLPGNMTVLVQGKRCLQRLQCLKQHILVAVA
jgi:hypothetical protein